MIRKKPVRLLLIVFAAMLMALYGVAALVSLA
jgi:hypothetical protein